MKLITKQLEKELAKFPLYSQDGKAQDAIVVAKFFLQSFTWYVLEFDGQDTFFGLVLNGDEAEYGYFSLSELQSVRGQFGLGVERDMYFKQSAIKDTSDYYLKEYYKKNYAA